MEYKLVAQQEIRAAQQDRASYFKAPSTGWQMAFALVDAAARQQKHPLSEQIGRTAARISDYMA